MSSSTMQASRKNSLPKPAWRYGACIHGLNRVVKIVFIAGKYTLMTLITCILAGVMATPKMVTKDGFEFQVCGPNLPIYIIISLIKEFERSGF